VYSAEQAKETPPLVVASEEEGERVVIPGSLTDSEIEEALAELCCKKCFGRGFIGWTMEDDPILCDCVRKRGRNT
jgi:hypothetical protein